MLVGALNWRDFVFSVSASAPIPQPENKYFSITDSAYAEDIKIWKRADGIKRKFISSNKIQIRFYVSDGLTNTGSQECGIWIYQRMQPDWSHQTDWR